MNMKRKLVVLLVMAACLLTAAFIWQQVNKKAERSFVAGEMVKLKILGNAINFFMQENNGVRPGSVKELEDWAVQTGFADKDSILLWRYSSRSGDFAKDWVFLKEGPYLAASPEAIKADDGNIVRLVLEANLKPSAIDEALYSRVRD